MTKHNIYSSVRISLYIAFLMGFFPTYIGKVDGRVVAKTNKFCLFIIFVNLLVFVSMGYMGSQGFNPVTEGDTYSFNTLAKLLILVVTFFGFLGTCALLIQGFFHKDLLKFFFNSIASLDKTLGKLGYHFNYQSDFYLYFILTVGGPIMCFANVLMELWNVKRENLPAIPSVLLFLHLYEFGILHHGESVFVLCNIILRKRFETLNLILKKMNDRYLMRNNGKEIKPFNDFLKNYKTDDKLLEICMFCHDKLSDLFDVVNRVFGILLIAGSLVQFNTIVFAFCYCYYSISIRPISTLGWFFWALFRIYELTRKAISAHTNITEAQACLNLVTKLLMHCDSGAEQKLQIFALQIKHRNNLITALGLFPIDGSSAFTIIGATTIYITIIYQFQVNKFGCENY